MREVVALKDLPRSEWLAARRTGIGGSDVGPLLNLSRFSGPLDVYADKVTDDVTPETPMMRMGRVFEDGILRLYEEETGATVERPTHLYCHDQDRWRLANPDGFTNDDGLGIAEAKWSTRPVDWEDGPPEAAELQCHHYMGVTGLEYADLIVVLGGRELRIFRIERDEALLENLIGIEADFWDRVERRDPPPPDARSGEALKRIYRGGGAVVDLPTEYMTTVAALREATARKVRATADVEEQKNVLRAAMGDHERATIAGVKVANWTTVNSTKVDLAALEIDHPDLVASYRRSKPYRRFTLKASK
jgi:putative phage-type endonuclease